MATATVQVSGMTCQHCVKTVQQALEAVDGVEQAKVDLQAGRAVVEYDDGRTDAAMLAEAVSEQGYGATVG